MSVWFITGASRGFGLEITRQALGRGDQVAATARHPEAIAEAIPDAGTPCWPCRSTSPTLARRPRRSRQLPRGSAGSTRWSTTRGAVCSAQSKRSPTPRRGRYSTSTSSACSPSPAPSCRSCGSRVRGRSSTCRSSGGFVGRAGWGGLSLWPVVRDLLSWGDEYYSANGPRRVFQHAQDAGTIAPDGTCAACGSAVPPSDLLLLPGPGYDGEGDDFVSKSLTTAHRLLEPVRGH